MTKSEHNYIEAENAPDMVCPFFPKNEEGELEYCIAGGCAAWVWKDYDNWDLGGYGRCGRTNLLPQEA